MAYRPPIAFILIFLVLATIQARSTQETNKAQIPPPGGSNQITPEEIKQAQEVANHFIERFRETRDLTPIVDEMFTSKFKNTIAKETSWSGIVGLGTSLAEHLSDGERLRCFNVQFSLSYLMRLYAASKVPLESKAPSQPERLFPPKIIQFFKDNAPREEEIKTAEQARNVLLFLEQSLKLMQQEIAKNPPEETAQFKKNLEAFAAHLDEHKEEKPSGTVYEEERYGLPAGTRLVRVIIPFHVGLIMIKEKGEFKIDLAATYLPPD